MIRIFDTNTRSVIMKWSAHTGKVTNVWFSADETTIMSCGEDKKVKLFME